MNTSIAEELSNKSASKYLPLDITWEITKKCNQECLPCYVSSSGKKELTLSEGNRLVDSLSSAGTLYITFTGGEPFLRKKELKSWAFRAQKNAIAVTVFTNGTLIKKADFGWLKDLCPLSIHISLFGADSGIHDSITQSRGSFGKAVASIEKLVSMGLQVVVKTLLIKENFSETEGIIKFAKSLGIQWSFDPVVTPKEDGSKDALKYRLERTQIEKIFKDSKSSYASKFKPNTKDEFICLAGSNMAAVSAYGDVYPCLMFPQPVGSLKEKTFSQIWRNSRLLKKMRALSIDDLGYCSHCGYLKYCSWCPGFAMLEDNNAFGRSSVSCMLAEVTKKTLNK